MSNFLKWWKLVLGEYELYSSSYEPLYEYLEGLSSGKRRVLTLCQGFGKLLLKVFQGCFLSTAVMIACFMTSPMPDEFYVGDRAFPLPLEVEEMYQVFEYSLKEGIYEVVIPLPKDPTEAEEVLELYHEMFVLVSRQYTQYVDGGSNWLTREPLLHLFGMGIRYRFYDKELWEGEELLAMRQSFWEEVDEILTFLREEGIPLYDVVANPYVFSWEEMEGQNKVRLSEDLPELQQLELIFAYVASLLEYPEDTTEVPYYSMPYGAVTRGVVHCVGYTALFNALVERQGFEVLGEHGKGRSESDTAHIWSKVKVDGEWLRFDVTAGDHSCWVNMERKDHTEVIGRTMYNMNFFAMTLENIERYYQVFPYQYDVTGEMTT